MPRSVGPIKSAPGGTVAAWLPRYRIESGTEFLRPADPGGRRVNVAGVAGTPARI